MAERDIGYKRKMAVSVFTGLIVQSFQMWYQYSSKKVTDINQQKQETCQNLISNGIVCETKRNPEE